jgi:uncharacterized protein (TIGR03067 family)
MLPRRALVGGLLLTVGLTLFSPNRPLVAQGQPKPEPAKPELKAVAFGTDEKAATDKLNSLAAEGWEYVGPLANGLVAFRRFPSARDLAAKKEAEKLQGTWTRVSVANKATRIGASAGDTITYSGDTFTQKVNGTVIQAGTFKIDPTANPKHLDYFVTQGKHKGIHYRSIYKIEGNLLHVCTDDGTTKRPKEFSGEAGFYRVVRRQKP